MGGLSKATSERQFQLEVIAGCRCLWGFGVFAVALAVLPAA